MVVLGQAVGQEVGVGRRIVERRQSLDQDIDDAVAADAEAHDRFVLEAGVIAHDLRLPGSNDLAGVLAHIVFQAPATDGTDRVGLGQKHACPGPAIGGSGHLHYGGYSVRFAAVIEFTVSSEDVEEIAHGAIVWVLMLLLSSNG